MNPEFWHRKKVFVTGHTGFKGSWLSLWLQNLGAHITGYALAPPTQPNLFTQADIAAGMTSITGDVLDLDRLHRGIQTHAPEVVFHMGAQSLVRRSYRDPVGTYAANVMGTVHLLQAVRDCTSVRAVVVVTSDKCYDNRESNRAFCEGDTLGGDDPYSSSKACAELVTAAFRKSFFSDSQLVSRIGIASARAGNVIGGGDWAEDRLVPDVVRSILESRQVFIRNPNALRPWQHVLEPLRGYLSLAEMLCDEPARFSEAWNFGPCRSDAVPVADLLRYFSRLWDVGFQWRSHPGPHPHEARRLTLDCTKSKTKLNWQPQWNLDRAMEATIEWYKAYQHQQDVRTLMFEQIADYQAAIDSPATSRQALPAAGFAVRG